MNGALNQLSQDFAYRQDGGVWEWSALADYDTQRLVRGSDGILYYSVAPSGPGLAAGSQDPTLDASHDYWVSPHVPTMPADDSSNAAASTAWLPQWFSAQRLHSVYYIDSVNGDDSNDGLTAGTAKKTIDGIKNVLSNNIFPLPSKITVYFASGSYGTLNLYLQGVTFILSGPSSGYAEFSGASYNVSGVDVYLSGRIKFTGTVYIARGSSVSVGGNAYINFDNLGSVYTAIQVYQSGVFTMFSDVVATIAFTGTNSFTRTLSVASGAQVYLSSGLTFSGTVTGKRYACVHCAGIDGAGSETRIPGSTAGTVDSTSYYN